MLCKRYLPDCNEENKRNEKLLLHLDLLLTNDISSKQCTEKQRICKGGKANLFLSAVSTILIKLAENHCIMTFREIVNFQLIRTETIDIKVYHTFIILLSILVAFVVLLIIRKAFIRVVRLKKIDQGTSNSLMQLIRYIVWILTIGFILDTIGIQITIFLAGSAALLVGLGLGIQHIFNDYISGILILFEQNVKVGDVIEIEDQVVGKIEKIGLRTSMLKTRDDISIILPNGKLVSDNIINWSHLTGKTRFHVMVGVAYGSDTEKVERILLKCAEDLEMIEGDPKPFVRFLDFGDSSLDFQLFFWTSEVFLVENIKSQLRFRINREFAANGIKIPFPQRDLHIRSGFHDLNK